MCGGHIPRPVLARGYVYMAGGRRYSARAEGLRTIGLVHVAHGNASAAVAPASSSLARHLVSRLGGRVGIVQHRISGRLRGDIGRRPGDESIQRPAGSPLFLEAKANRCPNHRRASESDAADADPALRPPRPGDYPHASSPHPTPLPFHARRPGQASHALPPPPDHI
jgi:hypothetical protein